MAPNCAMPESVPISALGAIVGDRLLDGRLILNQPQKGHRAGSDAILLAAALPLLGEGPLLDMGAGVGTVGLAAALSQPDLRVVLVERDADLAALAQRNIEANGLSARANVIAADIEAPAATLIAAGLAPASFACVAMNPPFYAARETRASPVPNRRAAHVADGSLDNWFKAARRLLRPGGRIAIIHRAEALAQLLAGLSTGFGGVVIRPIHALPERPAIRVVVTAVLNSKKPAVLLPAFILNRPDGGLTEISEALHRGQVRLDMNPA
jgi:tRNA1(Val) A37 N6-methylase TrmN6